MKDSCPAESELSLEERPPLGVADPEETMEKASQVSHMTVS